MDAAGFFGTTSTAASSVAWPSPKEEPLRRGVVEVPSLQLSCLVLLVLRTLGVWQRRLASPFLAIVWRDNNNKGLEASIVVFISLLFLLELFSVFSYFTAGVAGVAAVDFLFSTTVCCCWNNPMGWLPELFRLLV